MNTTKQVLPIVVLSVLTLFFLTACKKIKLLELGEAENQVFTQDGQYILSAGTGVFEVVEDDHGEFVLRSLLENDCQFQGILSIEQFLVTVCNTLDRHSKRLMYSSKSSAFTDWHTLIHVPELELPNGLAFDGQDTIFIANSPYIKQGGIAKLRLNITANDLFVEDFQADWKGRSNNIYNANGIKFYQGRLYFTDLGQLKVIDLSSGVVQAQTLYSRFTIFDDIEVNCAGLFITDYIAGQLLFVNFDGRLLYESPKLLFPGASSIAISHSPRFGNKNLLITERGLVQESKSPLGNQLSLLPLDEGLKERLFDCSQNE